MGLQDRDYWKERNNVRLDTKAERGKRLLEQAAQQNLKSRWGLIAKIGIAAAIVLYAIRHWPHG